MGGAYSRPCLLETPFRRHGGLSTWTNEERKNLQNEIRETKPYDNVDFDKYNLLIVGACRAGKSSFKNAIKSAFVGEVCHQADTGEEITSLTKKFTIGPIRGKDGRGLGHFRCVDMPGLDFFNVDPDTIGGILEGRLPHNYEFIDGVPPTLNAEPIPKNMIHCLVMVMDGTKTSMLNHDNHIFRILCDYRKRAREKDIPVALVLTHLDETCSCVLENLSNVFTCKAVKDSIKSAARLMNVEENLVFVVENYTKISHMEVDVKVDNLVLVTLKHLLQLSREHGDSWLDAHGHDD